MISIIMIRVLARQSSKFIACCTKEIELLNSLHIITSYIAIFSRIIGGKEEKSYSTNCMSYIPVLYKF